MRIDFQSTNNTQFDQKSPVLMNRVQFSTADTMISGTTKDESSCFTSFLNALTWPFRKIWELIFCCGKSNASNDWILDEIMKDPASAAKQWVEKYPDQKECFEELNKVGMENPNKMMEVPNQQGDIFNTALLSFFKKDDLLILGEIAKDPLAAAVKWTKKYPDFREGRDRMYALLDHSEELKISKEKGKSFEKACAKRWFTNGIQNHAAEFGYF